MRARTLVQILLAASPALYLGTIAFTARASFSDWITPEYGPKVHKYLLNYSQLLGPKAQNLSLLPRSELSEFQAEAKRWVEETNAGKLADIGPATYLDSGQDGVRSEIEQRRSTILLGLARYGKEFFESGRINEGIKTLKIATELIKINRYQNPMASVHSAEAFRIIGSGILAPTAGLTEGQKVKVLEVASTVDADPDRPLIVFEKQAEKKKNVAWADLPGQGAARPFMIGRTASLENPRIEHLSKEYGATAIPVDLARMAWISEKNMADVIKRLHLALQPKAN